MMSRCKPMNLMPRRKDLISLKEVAADFHLLRVEAIETMMRFLPLWMMIPHGSLSHQFSFRVSDRCLRVKERERIDSPAVALMIEKAYTRT